MKLKHHQKICSNEWSSYLSFSNTHSCSFWNGSVWLELAESVAGRVVLLQLLSIHDGAVGVTNLGVMLLCSPSNVLSPDWHCHVKETRPWSTDFQGPGEPHHMRMSGPRKQHSTIYCSTLGETNHNTGTWWRHQMETFSALLTICAGNSPVNGEFPENRPVTRSIDGSLICARINSWANNREAGGLRRHHAQYHVFTTILRLESHWLWLVLLCDLWCNAQFCW